MSGEFNKINYLAKHYLPSLIYALLALGILWALLKPGYILTLDSTQLFSDPIGRFFGLNQGIMATSAGIPADWINYLFARMHSTWVFAKIFLFIMFWLAGLGAHHLISSKGIGSYFTGILYAINPYTYIRFMAGQWGVLWAYAIMPFAVKAFLELIEIGNIKAAIKLAILATLVGLLDLHGFFLLILVGIIFLLIYCVKNRREQLHLRQTVKAIVLSTGLFLLLNLYWLIPVLTAEGTLVGQIGEADLFFFAPHSTSTFGIMFDVASLWAFWRTGYVLTSNLISFWWIFFLIILFLSTFGFISYFKNKTNGWLVISLAVLWLVSLILAVGAASDLTRPVFEWVWNNIPFFKGFRDSHKFVSLLCLTYAVLGGLGVHAFFDILKQQKNKVARFGYFTLISLALFTPIIYSFSIFNFHGQIKTTDYPKEWYNANAYLNRDKTDFNVLFLPWHQYMDYSWLPNQDKRLANPAQQFFEKPVIAGDNMESGGIYSQSTNPISKYIEFLLSKGNEITNLGELLAPLNVKYIILVQEADYRLYDHLYQQQDLKIVMEEPGITLLENEYPTTRAYAVNSVVHITSLDDYIELSKTQDVMEHVYVIGAGTDDGTTAPFTPIETTEKSPVNFRTGSTTKPYIIFTVPQNVSVENWTYNGNNTVMTNLGFMPVFASSPAAGNLVYARFYRVYLPCYIVSFITVIGIVILYIKKRK